MGDPLRAGDVVLSGALGPMVPAPPCASFRAELSGLGEVAVTFDDPGET
jgi:2-keto-4-pentenoate hydratase